MHYKNSKNTIIERIYSCLNRLQKKGGTTINCRLVNIFAFQYFSFCNIHIVRTHKVFYNLSVRIFL